VVKKDLKKSVFLAIRNLLAVSFACAVGLAFGSGPVDVNGMIGGLLSSGSRMIRVPRQSYFLENAVVFGAKKGLSLVNVVNVQR